MKTTPNRFSLIHAIRHRRRAPSRMRSKFGGMPNVAETWMQAPVAETFPTVHSIAGVLCAGGQSLSARGAGFAAVIRVSSSSSAWRAVNGRRDSAENNALVRAARVSHHTQARSSPQHGHTARCQPRIVTRSPQGTPATEPLDCDRQASRRGRGTGIAGGRSCRYGGTCRLDRAGRLDGSRSDECRERTKTRGATNRAPVRSHLAGYADRSEPNG
jgi:hypothetical protein